VTSQPGGSRGRGGTSYWPFSESGGGGGQGHCGVGKDIFARVEGKSLGGAEKTAGGPGWSFVYFFSGRKQANAPARDEKIAPNLAPQVDSAVSSQNSTKGLGVFLCRSKGGCPDCSAQRKSRGAPICGRAAGAKKWGQKLEILTRPRHGGGPLGICNAMAGGEALWAPTF